MNIVTRSIHGTLHLLLLPFSLVFTRLISLLLTSRGKRIFFTASLYTYLNDIDPYDMKSEQLHEYLTEVNELFQLTKTEKKAILLPMYLHDAIWSRIALPDAKSLLNLTMQSNCEMLLRHIPRWLRYDRAVMRNDAMLILRSSVGRQLQIENRT